MEQRLLNDRRTYRQQDFKCCWTCRHSFQRMGLTLLCGNKEASVQPLGVCEGYEWKGAKE